MYDVRVDFDEFYQEFGIKVTNPVYRNEALPAKHKIMIALREKYIKHRNVYRRIFREKESEEFMLDSGNYESSGYEINCSAEPQYNCKTGEKIEPFIELEAIEIVDILPKEFLLEFKKKIQRMLKGKYVYGFNHTEETNVDIYKKVHNSFFKFSAATLAFKPGCEFSRYASRLNIEMLSLSSSFVGIVYRFWINEEWKDKINKLCVSDRAKHEFYSGIENLRWYQFRRIGKGANPGNIYKEKILAVLLEEIKYRLAEELHKDFRSVIFSMNNKPIAFNVFKTNIDGNSSKEFWNSIGIEARFCDFINGQDACINSLHQHNVELDYIYKRNIVPECKGLIDEFSVSLNGATKEEYDELSQPKFAQAYEEVKNFIKACSDEKISVVASVVEGYKGRHLDLKKCEEIANNLGAKFRVREWIKNGY